MLYKTNYKNMKDEINDFNLFDNDIEQNQNINFDLFYNPLQKMYMIILYEIYVNNNMLKEYYKLYKQIININQLNKMDE